MTVRVLVKEMRKLHKTVKPTPFFLDGNPKTVRELLSLAVDTSISEYLARREAGKNPHPLSDEEEELLRESGRILFCLLGEEKEIDRSAAKERAHLAYFDGLFRVFQNGKELGALDGEIAVQEGDEFLFVRLTMLSGRLW